MSWHVEVEANKVDDPSWCESNVCGLSVFNIRALKTAMFKFSIIEGAMDV